MIVKFSILYLMFLVVFALPGVSGATDLLKAEDLATGKWCYQGHSLGYREELLFSNSGQVAITRFTMGLSSASRGSWALKDDILTVNVASTVFEGSNVVQANDGKTVKMMNEETGREVDLYRCD